jgi:hypothetical protein
MVCRFGLLIRMPLMNTAAVLLLVLVGCGKDGNRVSGTITFDNKPVPAGKIYFTPDGSQGNSGAPGYADIVDGKYDTSLPGGRGTSSGAMVVGIEGIDPNNRPPGADEDVTVTVLFPRYEMKAEITSGNAVMDFDVPPEAALGPKEPTGPAFISP